MTLVAAHQVVSYPKESQPRYPSSPTPSVASTVSSWSSSAWSVASSASSTSVSSTTIESLPPPETTGVPPTCVRPPGKEHISWPQQNNAVPAKDRHPQPPPLVIPQVPVPIERRQNPRRTNRLVEGSSSGSEGCPRPVPTLQRQVDRKGNFVDNLVDSAAQIVETIWPPSRLSGCQISAKDTVLPLRTFIQETLRRSRTSYSTLQVALYYLIVIRPHLPSRDCDFSSMPPEDAQMIRAKQCGRRMFLAALILASKYLQDRNYSARAWSKISGLNTQEINVNEMAFLAAVSWRLHISEVNFIKWTDLVLKYTSPPSPSPVSPNRSSPWFDEEERKKEWCDLVLRLSPDLTEVELTPARGLKRCATDVEVVTSTSLLNNEPCARATPVSATAAQKPKSNTLPLPPRILESHQQSHAFNSLHQPLPKKALQIPPPPPPRRSTQSSSGLNTPAVGLGSGNEFSVPISAAGGAMASVAQAVHSNMISGCTQETWSFMSRKGSENMPTMLVTSSPAGRFRRSSLSKCLTGSPVTMASPSVIASSGLSCYSPGGFASRSSISSVSARPSPTFPYKRQTSGLVRLATGVDVPVTMTTTTTTPALSSGTVLPSVHQFHRTSFQDVKLERHWAPSASPKSTEAAMSLNMLRENYSPCSSGSTTPTGFGLSRKRSYPGTSDTGRPSSVLRRDVSTTGPSDGATNITPKMMSTGFHGSPLSPALDFRSKRVRCASGMGIMEGMSMAQNVR